MMFIIKKTMIANISLVKLDSHCADSYRPMKRCYRRGIHRQARCIHIVAMLSPGRIMN